jgi:hypothetical protein
VSRPRTVVLLPHAQLDVVSIVVYLDAQRDNLGTVRFRTALVDRLEKLETDYFWPMINRKRAIRMAPMDRAWEKYGIFFSVLEDEIHVRAVLQLNRNVRRHVLKR